MYKAARVVQHDVPIVAVLDLERIDAGVYDSVYVWVIDQATGDYVHALVFACACMRVQRRMHVGCFAWHLCAPWKKRTAI